MTVKEFLNTLACESGGGVIPSDPLAAQGIRAVALFLTDGRVLGVSLENGGDGQ